MEFVKEIKSRYKIGEPIYTKDLVKHFSTSRQNIMDNLRRSVKNGDIRRMMQGVYYIPKKEVIYGIEIDNAPSSEVVVEDKYIGRGKNRFGIYGGTILKNKLQLTEQLPAIITIITNREKSNKRMVRIENTDHILQRPYTKINNKNYKAYMVAEVIRLNGILSGKKNQIVKEFIKENKISRKQIEEVIKYFPKKTQNDYEISEVWND